LKKAPDPDSFFLSNRFFDLNHVVLIASGLDKPSANTLGAVSSSPNPIDGRIIPE
jgi:hypothetical protein